MSRRTPCRKRERSHPSPQLRRARRNISWRPPGSYRSIFVWRPSRQSWSWRDNSARRCIPSPCSLFRGLWFVPRYCSPTKRELLHKQDAAPSLVLPRREQDYLSSTYSVHSHVVVPRPWLWFGHLAPNQPKVL